MNELPKDRFSEYFHIELSKYYYSYLTHHELDELPEDYVLNFEFEDGTYSIQISEMLEKALEEREVLLTKQKEYDIDDEFGEIC